MHTFRVVAGGPNTDQRGPEAFTMYAAVSAASFFGYLSLPLCRFNLDIAIVAGASLLGGVIPEP